MYAVLCDPSHCFSYVDSSWRSNVAGVPMGTAAMARRRAVAHPTKQRSTYRLYKGIKCKGTSLQSLPYGKAVASVIGMNLLVAYGVQAAPFPSSAGADDRFVVLERRKLESILSEEFSRRLHSLSSEELAGMLEDVLESRQSSAPELWSHVSRAQGVDLQKAGSNALSSVLGFGQSVFQGSQRSVDTPALPITSPDAKPPSFLEGAAKLLTGQSRDAAPANLEPGQVAKDQPEDPVRTPGTSQAERFALAERDPEQETQDSKAGERTRDLPSTSFQPTRKPSTFRGIPGDADVKPNAADQAVTARPQPAEQPAAIPPPSTLAWGNPDPLAPAEPSTSSARDGSLSGRRGIEADKDAYLGSDMDADLDDATDITSDLLSRVLQRPSSQDTPPSQALERGLADTDRPALALGPLRLPLPATPSLPTLPSLPSLPFVSDLSFPSLPSLPPLPSFPSLRSLPSLPSPSLPSLPNLPPLPRLALPSLPSPGEMFERLGEGMQARARATRNQVLDAAVVPVALLVVAAAVAAALQPLLGSNAALQASRFTQMLAGVIGGQGEGRKGEGGEGEGTSGQEQGQGNSQGQGNGQGQGNSQRQAGSGPGLVVDNPVTSVRDAQTQGPIRSNGSSGGTPPGAVVSQPVVGVGEASSADPEGLLQQAGAVGGMVEGTRSRDLALGIGGEAAKMAGAVGAGPVSEGAVSIPPPIAIDIAVPASAAAPAAAGPARQRLKQLLDNGPVPAPLPRTAPGGMAQLGWRQGGPGVAPASVGPMGLPSQPSPQTAAWRNTPVPSPSLSALAQAQPQSGSGPGSVPEGGPILWQRQEPPPAPSGPGPSSSAAGSVLWVRSDDRPAPPPLVFQTPPVPQAPAVIPSSSSRGGRADLASLLSNVDDVSFPPPAPAPPAAGQLAQPTASARGSSLPAVGSFAAAAAGSGKHIAAVAYDPWQPKGGPQQLAALPDGAAQAALELAGVTSLAAAELARDERGTIQSPWDERASAQTSAAVTDAGDVKGEGSGLSVQEEHGEGYEAVGAEKAKEGSEGEDNASRDLAGSGAGVGKVGEGEGMRAADQQGEGQESRVAAGKGTS